MASNKELLTQIEEFKKTSKERKFTESIELSINMKEIDLSDPKNRINEEIPLPKGRGRELKVAVFGTDEMKGKANDTADFLYGPEDLGRFSDDK